MKQTLTAVLAAGSIAASLAASTTDVSAGGRGSFATGAAVGVVGGLLLGTAIANSRPAYAAPVAVAPAARTCISEEQIWSNRRQAWVVRPVRYAC